MNRDLLAAEAEGYRKGRESFEKEYASGHHFVLIAGHKYVLSAFAEYVQKEVESEIRIEAEKEGYRKGRALAIDEMEFLCLTREQEAYREGRADQKRVQYRYEWLTLAIVMFDVILFAYAVIGIINYIGTL